VKAYFLHIIIIFCLITPLINLAQNDSTAESIKQDIFIHPADGYTGYCLKKGTWFYAQPIDLKPGLLQIGLNDKNTLILPTQHWFEKTKDSFSPC